jgi:nucleoside-diphosphate-sugar epimerase
LRSGAALADGVIHTAFNHDFSKYAANCEADRHAIQALGSPLLGSDRPFIVTSGTLVAAVPPGRPATEDDAPVASSAIPRSASEEAAVLLESKGVRALVVRLPQVHDRLKHGLVSYLIAIAREKRISAFVGDGLNRWPAVHRIDAARLYVLALEKGSAGARYHAVAEEGVPLRDIAAAIGRGLKVPVVALSPEQATSHFGWLAVFVGRDAPAASALTQERLGWHPTAQPGMIDDLDHARDFEGCVPGPCLGGAGLQPISANLLKGNQLPCCRPATRNIVAPAVDYPREAANISNARSTDKRRTKNRRTLADFSLLICLTPASANHLNESVPFVM